MEVAILRYTMQLSCLKTQTPLNFWLGLLQNKMISKVVNTFIVKEECIHLILTTSQMNSTFSILCKPSPWRMKNSGLEGQSVTLLPLSFPFKLNRVGHRFTTEEAITMASGELIDLRFLNRSLSMELIWSRAQEMKIGCMQWQHPVTQTIIWLFLTTI